MNTPTLVLNMATEVDSSQLSERFTDLQIENNVQNGINCDKTLTESLEYGLPLNEVYRLAHNFYKGTFYLKYFNPKFSYIY